MRRLTCKEIARALGVAETKATQALQPAMFKLAALFLLYPDLTMHELSIYIAQLREQWKRERPELLESPDR